eukprot:CAMPEP_0185269648 /NCGR_PEP_ID=MMETSP1359-20130426/40402_1 /TAXON_ID=552665 /ORGANISM="Bigelowiella longifila, Strain CCMP242" /LENGTH=48 /DNA_ID= /DNA_START= /DNA_END= /DNA_ORIENTATION=
MMWLGRAGKACTMLGWKGSKALQGFGVHADAMEARAVMMGEDWQKWHE